jgi:hypothetical protein
MEMGWERGRLCLLLGERVCVVATAAAAALHDVEPDMCGGRRVLVHGCCGVGWVDECMSV